MSRAGGTCAQGMESDTPVERWYRLIVIFFLDVAQFGSAPGLGPGGCEFESRHPDFPVLYNASI